MIPEILTTILLYNNIITKKMLYEDRNYSQHGNLLP